MITSSDILHFWFETLEPAQWWKVDSELDATICDRFTQTHQQAMQGELFCWRKDPEGRLAEIIVLDQFSRNIHRGKPDAFSSDPLALALAQEMVLHNYDQQLTTVQKSFCYLPYMHSESVLIHEQAVKLYSQKGLEYNLDFEDQHKRIIDRFGRYPHRNEILGRESTDEEIAFLKEPNSSF
jgi:uncharacterized protein (DUF924 family)